jgi:hypothetical protein
MEAPLHGFHGFTDKKKRIGLIVAQDLLKLAVELNALFFVKFAPVLFQNLIHPLVLVADKIGSLIGGLR